MTKRCIYGFAHMASLHLKYDIATWNASVCHSQFLIGRANFELDPTTKIGCRGWESLHYSRIQLSQWTELLYMCKCFFEKNSVGKRASEFI